jgi:hypothetical protein
MPFAYSHTKSARLPGCEEQIVKIVVLKPGIPANMCNEWPVWATLRHGMIGVDTERHAICTALVTIHVKWLNSQ